MNTSYKHNVYLLRSAAFITEFIYFTSYTTYSTHLFRRGTARSTSLRSRTGQDDHRPSGRTTYRTDFTANQLVGLLGTHSCSAFTLPPTSWLDCSSHGLHRQLCWGLASYAEDSSVFRFFVQALLAKLGTPLEIGSCYVSLVCYQVVP